MSDCPREMMVGSVRVKMAPRTWEVETDARQMLDS